VEISSSAERILSSLLETRTGQQLTLSRRWRIDSALSSIMREHEFASLDQLVARIVSGRDPALAEKVIEALLNNETYFYRDKLPFDLLLGGPLAKLRAKRTDRRLAIWCAGCSTGQEVYSLAMSLADEIELWDGWRIDIVGTDLSRAAVERAKAGAYSQFEVQRGLPVIQMVRWFEELGGGAWQISPEIQRMVRFESRNIIDAPPTPGRFDVVLCRNLLLYFSPEVRRLAFMRLAQAIAPDGTLMLGAGETALGQTDRFVSDPDHRGLYVPAPAGSQAALARARVA
jgi:chemotaxis protein methyltransferase CheR